MNIKSKVTALAGNLKTHWKTPPQGRYMTYKEIASLAGGGIGVRMISYFLTQMTITTGNTLLGNTIGIDPIPLQAIYMISLLTAFPLTAIRARMIDNTKSMKGKYRPYLLMMGLPTVILGSLFIWMPYENMSLFAKCAVVLGFNIAFQFFCNFFFDAYDSLINVLSPNSIERSDVLSIRFVVENISPSIVSILFPLFARLVTGEDTLYDIRAYRYVYPPMLFLGFLVSLIVYKNTTEKIVQAKTHKIQIKFSDAFRAVAGNKYFWIISLAGWIGFLETGFQNIMQWMYNYQSSCSAGQYAVITAIAGNASFWPNLIGPFLIRRYGKKKILIYTNALSVVFILCMLPVIKMAGQPAAIWILLIFTFINQLITSLGHMLAPSVNADIRDYQHYISGERIDGMFAAVGLIGNVITMVTGLALPAIYERAGLNQEVAKSLGYDGSIVYDVLYNKEYFISICSVLIVASAIGAAMNVIPYFFYDFTEAKQKAVVNVLQIRAMFEDYAENGEITEKLKETIELIKKSKELAACKPQDLSVAKKDKKLYYKMRKENEELEVACFVVEELGKYETAEGKAALEAARKLTANGPESFMTLSFSSKQEIKAMPRATQIQQNFRRDALTRLQNIKAARKTVQRHYPDGIEIFDTALLDELYASEQLVVDEFNGLCAQIKSAKENKNSALAKQLNAELKTVKAQKEKAAKEIKAAENKYSLYCRAVKPYLDAERVIAQANSYKNLASLEALV